MPVSVFFTTTLAPSTTSPFGSVTVPVIAPVEVCASADAENLLRSKAVASIRKPQRTPSLEKFLMSSTPPYGLPRRELHPLVQSQATGSDPNGSPADANFANSYFLSPGFKN